MRVSVLATVVVLALGLAGCKTTSQPIEGPAVDKMVGIIQKVCKIGHNGVAHRGVNQDAVDVYAIDKGQNGWYRVDFMALGLRDHLYVNPRQQKGACGRRAWQSLGLVFVKALDADGQPESWPPSPGDAAKRPVAISWEGRADLVAGEIEINERHGKVRARLPDGSGGCTGAYQATEPDPTTGTWTLTCSDGSAASGTYQALGRGKGSVGEGFDAEGRRVRYTIGAR